MRNKKTLIACFLLVNTALGQQPRQEDSMEYIQPPETINDSENYSHHKISDAADTVLYQHPIFIAGDSILSLKKKAGYLYIQNLDSLLRVWKNSVQEAPGNSRSMSLFERILSSGFLQILMWMAAAIFVFYLLYRFFLTTGVSQFKKSKPIAPDTPGPEEILTAAGYTSLIDKCYVAGDYRLATRYYFLKILQLLNERQHIHFSTEKTNAAYLYEMPVSLQQSFSKIALLYEYVWYGKKAIDKNSFSEIENTCKEFVSHI